LFLKERSALNECWSQHWRALLTSLLGKEEAVEVLVTDWETEVMSNTIVENISETSKKTTTSYCYMICHGVILPFQKGSLSNFEELLKVCFASC